MGQLGVNNNDPESAKIESQKNWIRLDDVKTVSKAVSNKCAFIYFVLWFGYSASGMVIIIIKVQSFFRRDSMGYKLLRNCDGHLGSLWYCWVSTNSTSSQHHLLFYIMDWISSVEHYFHLCRRDQNGQKTMLLKTLIFRGRRLNGNWD
ncbi:uncharacterized protein LOC120332800 [Styela clava]